MVYPSHIKKNHIVQTHEEHSTEVAELCRKWGKDFGLEKTCQLVGLLHDIGKGTNSFRDYIEYSYAHPDDKSQKGKVDHSTHGAKYIYERYKEGNVLERFTAEWIAMAILSHHGGLQDFITLDGKSDFLRRVMEKELPTFDESKIVFFQRIADENFIDELFTQAVQEVETFIHQLDLLIANDEEYYFCYGMMLKVLFSILVDADRLNTTIFMTGLDPCHEWNMKQLWDDFSDKLEDKLAGFIPVNEIQRTRQRIADECLQFAKHPSGIYDLSVPTGSGKTLSSMRYALAHAKEYGKERILVVIPYTSIIDQNANEIRGIFLENEAVLEHHSNVVEDFTKENSLEIENGAYDQASEFRRAMTERWEVPVIFTTMVQFLNTLFAGGTKDIRRLHHLKNSVIIFDEIQTLPIKCTFLFNSAMNFISKICNTTIVLCTATQPTLEKIEMPIQKESPSEMVHNLDEIFEIFKRSEVENLCIAGGYTPEEVASLIWQDAVKRGNVLCIVNTTAMAKSIYRVLKSLQDIDDIKNPIFHLSTKMCPAHRKCTLKRIRERLNKKEPLICVSTQLVEAGVDLSFTTVYRDIAGLASIAQAAGRCNRHGEMDFGLVKIFNIKGEKFNKLPDIAMGVEISTNMLNANDIDMSELLSPKVMQRFFMKYYSEQSRKRMGYPTDAGRGTLYDLLATNAAGCSARKERGYATPIENLVAFREAGKEFHVIDSKTVSVLVPYKHGKELYLDFNSNVYQQENIYKKLKEAQQYMVNLFSYEVQSLLAQEAIHELAIGGIWALREGYYDPVMGVIVENQKNEFTSV